MPPVSMLVISSTMASCWGVAPGEAEFACMSDAKCVGENSKDLSSGWCSRGGSSLSLN